MFIALQAIEGLNFLAGEGGFLIIIQISVWNIF